MANGFIFIYTLTVKQRILKFQTLERTKLRNYRKL